MRDLQELIEKARSAPLNPEQQERQRQSFAYGNTKIENDRITRDIVAQAAERLTKQGTRPA